MERKVVSFEAVRGGAFSDHFRIYLSKLKMTKFAHEASSVSNDTVSHVIAYLDMRELHICFNKLSNPLQHEMEQVFSSFATQVESELAMQMTK